MGADGHTASLFPGSDLVRERSRWVAAEWVKKLGMHRITLTPPVLNSAACATFLISGPEKAEALREVLQGEYHPERSPAQVIRPRDGRLVWMIDQAAAGRLAPIR